MLQRILAKPWMQIWTHPRLTIREVVKTNPNALLLFWSFVSGFPCFLLGAQLFSLDIRHALWFFLLEAAIISPLLGFLWISFTALLLYGTGKILKGVAPYTHVRAVVAWATAPSVPNTLIGLFSLAVFAWNVVATQFPQMGTIDPSFVAYTVFIQLILSIWGMVICIAGLAEVQNFSIGKSIFNVFLAGVVFAIVNFSIVIFLNAMYQKSS